MASPARASVARVLEVWADDPSLVDVQILHPDGSAVDATRGQDLAEADRIRTGYKSHVRLDFAGKATVVVEELSEFKVGIFKLGKTSQVELWLKSGEIQAQVRKEAASHTEFAVRSPTATASVRGTKIKSIMYSSLRGLLIAMENEGSLLARSKKGPPLLVAKNENAHEEIDGHTFRDQAHLSLEQSRVIITPSGLQAQERDAANLNPLIPSPQLNVSSTGSSSGAIPSGSLGSPLPSILLVEASLDPLVAQFAQQWGFNPVVTTDVSALGRSLQGYVGVGLIDANASSFTSQLQAFHDSGHGVFLTGRAAFLTYPTAVLPSYLGGGNGVFSTATVASVTAAGAQLTLGTVGQGTQLLLAPAQGTSSFATILAGSGNVATILAQTTEPMPNPPNGAAAYLDNGKGRAGFSSIDPGKSTAAMSFERALVRKVGGLP